MADRSESISPSSRVYEALRAAILRGDFHPGQPLKPQELALDHGVSLAVVRESLLRLVGEGLADRLPNRGFVVPAAGDSRWQMVAEARATLEPAMLRMAIERGDIEWEARVRAAHHRLAGTPAYETVAATHYSDAWGRAHHDFHRTLLDACGNDVMLDLFERLWTASELLRRWSGAADPKRDALAEHRRLEELTLARRGNEAGSALCAHISGTAAALTDLAAEKWPPVAADRPTPA